MRFYFIEGSTNFEADEPITWLVTRDGNYITFREKDTATRYCERLVKAVKDVMGDEDVLKSDPLQTLLTLDDSATQVGDHLEYNVRARSILML